MQFENLQHKQPDNSEESEDKILDRITNGVIGTARNGEGGAANDSGETDVTKMVKDAAAGIIEKHFPQKG